ncbi:hypothetical protein KKC22_15315 [Myxococcota bacterium]|nr:hypothetical protein [Myxococcota bacterium]
MHQFNKFLLCVWMVLFVEGACTSDLKPTGVFSAAETAYQARLAGVICAEAFGCPSLSVLPYASEAACVTELVSLREVDSGEYIHVTANGGAFDPAAFERCMQERLARACTDVRTWSADCDGYLQGTRALGQTCSFSSECADGWCTGTWCTHTCVARLPEESPCRLDEQCAAGLVCSRATGICARQERFTGPGEACDATRACSSGHGCSSLDGSGTCVPIAGDGETCSIAINCEGPELNGGCIHVAACAAGLSCVAENPEKDGEPIVAFCRPVPFQSEGETCGSVQMPWCDRSELLRCGSRVHSMTADTCYAVWPVGSTPVFGQGACEEKNATEKCCWDDSYWADGACRPRKRLGERCQDSQECLSRECWASQGETVQRCTRFAACIDANNKRGPSER